MPIPKDPVFAARDVCVDYPFESVMVRWDNVSGKIYREFYGEPEGAEFILHENRVFNDALLHGVEITEPAYVLGRIP